MDRYQIATMSDVKPIAYLFQASKSIVQVKDYMVKCITESVAFDGSNIPQTILDTALVQISKEYKAPIVTKDEVTAKVLAMTYNHKKIYSAEKIPESVGDIICYTGVDPSLLSKFKTLLVVIGSSNE